MKINSILDLASYCEENNCNNLAKRIQNMYMLRNSVGYAGRDLQYIFDITKDAVLNDDEEELLNIINELDASTDEDDLDFNF